ncbi:MAG: ROK family protein [Candidatus Sungbacteria bacterium]|uniref:ROK family protein n=1 Tax=Candidatus Sungiibacteriota bacterium TaxID=2750080 RepID=A0A9D6LSI0_9BACT|nr:ROK family protein [Candidatus Sungbacteria bacterium]
MYLGIDIGATWIRSVVLRGFLSQNFQAKKIQTPKSLAELKKSLSDIAKDFEGTKIGLSLAGFVPEGGLIIEEAPNISFLNHQSAADLLPDFSGEIRADNDARCFLSAEMAWGAARGFKDAVGVVVGTGIGGAVWKNGTFYVGDDGRAGEIGHWKKGAIEWEELARQEFAIAGDASNAYAGVISEAIHKFHPQAVVIGGGPIAAGKYDLEVLQKKVADRLGDIVPQIAFGALGDAAQAIGAALLFR